MSEKQIKIYTDGGSRGNPGPAAIGVVLDIDGNKNGYNQFIGHATNNEAEYSAAIFGLKKAKQLLGKDVAKKTRVSLFADSELMIKQMNGEYKIKDGNMANFFLEIWNLKPDFKSITFISIPREKNQEADKLVNQALDLEMKGKLAL